MLKLGHCCLRAFESLTTRRVGSGAVCGVSEGAALGLGLNTKGGRAVVGGGFVRTG